MDQYYSERESGVLPQTNAKIDLRVWEGIVALINRCIDRNYLAKHYPLKECRRNTDAITGTNWKTLYGEFSSDHPNIETLSPGGTGFVPKTEWILDLIEWFHERISVPQTTDCNMGHNHYSYPCDFSDEYSGKNEFRNEVNKQFRRNRIGYTLAESGKIERIATPFVGEAVKSCVFNTKDADVNRLLERARDLFYSHSETGRIESLEKLWDAWERIKSLEDTDKKVATKKILDKTSSGVFRDQVVEVEARSLTNIGNEFSIRHTEVGKEPIKDVAHAEYLFHRLFSLINLILPHIEKK